MQTSGSNSCLMPVMGFRKIDTERWEFAHEDFLQGQRHLLRNIRRRRSSQAHQPGRSGTCTELEKTDTEAQVEVLKRDKDALMQEVRKLSEQQQLTNTHIKSLNHRLQATEERQKQMLTFLAKAFVNPKLLTHLFLRQKDRKLPSQGRKSLPTSQQTDETSLCPSMERQLLEYKFEDSSSSLELSDLEINAGVEFCESVLPVMVPKDGLGTDGEARQGSIVSGSNLLPKKEDEDKYDVTALPTFESDISSLKGKSILNDDADRSDYIVDYIVSTPEDASMEAILASLTQDSNALVVNHNEMLDASVFSGEGCASSDVLYMNAIDLHTEEQDVADLWGVNLKQSLDASPIDLWASDLSDHQDLPIHSENQLGGSNMVADAKAVDLTGVGKGSC
ncbi:heat stress transcription factor A-3-like [Nymphaea colorata]|uniref:heat stress transcription factor A-3-like n=1 Tax=Nymphaea colorata TaxID=210225 RepID=UPI00129D5079|nr:heat stress transcription factor A-3-like [Nymphaea colorata]